MIKDGRFKTSEKKNQNGARPLISDSDLSFRIHCHAGNRNVAVDLLAITFETVVVEAMFAKTANVTAIQVQHMNGVFVLSFGVTRVSENYFVLSRMSDIGVIPISALLQHVMVGVLCMTLLAKRVWQREREFICDLFTLFRAV